MMQSETKAFVSSLAADDPAIPEVLDLRTGALIPADVAIGNEYGPAIKLRMALRQSIVMGSPLYVCPCCGVPVHLVCHAAARRFFFRHVLEDGRCTARTRGRLSEAEICARKYNGAKESQAHRLMKAILAESLKCDPRFHDIQVETVVKGGDGTWRKPDVQAIFDGMRVAFEIQVSTTFLRVLAERRAFYLQEGGSILVWVFQSFDADCARLTQDDIFYSNNSNLFIAGEETLTASRARGKCVLDCRWAEPFVENGQLRTRWDGQLVAFEDLQIDRSGQRVFHFDYDKQVLALRAGNPEILRRDFERFWLSRRNDEAYDRSMWNALVETFAAQGVPLPVEPNWGGAPANLLNVLYAAREGRPIGWRFRRLVEVACHVASRHKRLLRAFLHALDVYGRWKQVRQEDDEGAWRIQLEQCQPGLAVNSLEYEADSRFDGLVNLLFPELGGRGGTAARGSASEVISRNYASNLETR